MLVKFKLYLPKHLLIFYKKSTKNIIVFWIFSPQGLIKKSFSDLFFVKKDEKLSLFFLIKDLKKASSLRAQVTLFKNLLIGLSRQYRVTLWIKGVGFKFKLSSEATNRVLKLSLGYSHILMIKLPLSVSVFLVGKKKIYFKGLCLQELTQIVSYIQKFKIPDSYKGKGLNYKYKIKRLKPGKVGAS